MYDFASEFKKCRRLKKKALGMRSQLYYRSSQANGWTSQIPNWYTNCSK